MGVQVAVVAPAGPSSSSANCYTVTAAAVGSPARRRQSCSLFRGEQRLVLVGFGSRLPDGVWRIGGTRPSGLALRRAFSASLDGAGDSVNGGREGRDGFSRRMQPDSPRWPASLERSASTGALPLSLRMLKKQRQQQQQRWEEAIIDAGESACSSVRRAFSSMVFIIRELQSFTLQMRQGLFYEDLQGVLARVQGEMNASFVWLFQHIFSCTPTLMVSVMLLLANFMVYSMGHSMAIASELPPPPQTAVMVVESSQKQDTERPQPMFDSSVLKTFSVGRAASVGGNGGRGGNVRPVAGPTDDGRSDESSLYGQSRAVFPQGVSSTPASMSESATPAAAGEEALDEVALWNRMVQEAAAMQASIRDESLMDSSTVNHLVAPVQAYLETEDNSEHLKTEQRYLQAVSEDPENSLILSNFAQFLYIVLHDHDRAEHYFKKAVAVEPADAEALSRYATFLWKARDDLAAAEETYQEAIAAEPSNSFYAADYAHFLWNTGGGGWEADAGASDGSRAMSTKEWPNHGAA